MPLLPPVLYTYTSYAIYAVAVKTVVLGSRFGLFVDSPYSWGLQYINPANSRDPLFVFVKKHATPDPRFMKHSIYEISKIVHTK